MASTSGLTQNETDDGSSSHFQKTVQCFSVCLHDWWLIKAEADFEGKRLAVAGFTSREQQAVRVFTSAPVVKRYDVFTLETADGICVFIKGIINKLRTSGNGFPSEVFSHFLFGFPPNWEEYAAKLLEGNFTTCVHPGNISASDEFATHPEMVVGKKNCSPASKQTPKNNQLYSLSGYSMGQVSGNLSVDVRSKQKEEKIVVNGSESKRNKSIPFVSDDLSNILQNNNSEFEGIAASSPSADEVQERRHRTVLRKVDAECAGDGSQQKSDVKHSLNCGNIMTQGDLKTRNNNSARSPILRRTKCLKNAVKEGKSNAKEESMCSKRDFIYSPESLSFGRSRSGRPLVPTLEFWRNQLPVYDSDRNMTGIKDELIVIGQSRGSISKPQKKRSRS